MALVIDASVAVKFLVREVKTEEARALLAIPDPLIAPDWLLIEAASTFWKKVKRSELLAIHAERHLTDLPKFFERLHPARELVETALAWSLRLHHPVYDCLYVALALRENARLVTADEGLHAAVAGTDLAGMVEML